MTRPADGVPPPIECNEAPSVGVFWMMAAVLPALGFVTVWLAGVPLRYDVGWREFNPIAVIPIIAALAGLFFAIAAIFLTLRLRKFGVSVLTLQTAPRLGGSLRGRVTSTVDVPVHEWQIAVRCIEAIRMSGSSSSASQQRTDLERWKFETTLSGAAASSVVGVPIDVAIPADALALHDPLERARQRRGSLRWVLVLRGRRAGLDFVASFELPIRAADPARSQSLP